MKALSLRIKRIISGRPLYFAAAFGIIGVVAILTSFAAIQSNSVAIEAEQTASQSGTRVVTDASASSNSYVEFVASAPSPTPTTAPTPTVVPGSCPSAQHTPGGNDGFGGCWPYEGNTGVPTGTTLSNYTGPCTILSPTVIDSKNINCDFTVVSSLTIRKSKITGHIDADPGQGLVIEDSEIDAGSWTGPAVGFNNITIRRTEIIGGQHSILCSGNCIVEDSYLHGQHLTAESHNNGILSNGGNTMTIRHNTVWCTPPTNSTGGGCTGDLSLIGDFAQLDNITVDKNLLPINQGSRCMLLGYGGSKPFNQPTRITATNNVFQRKTDGKCGTSFTIDGFGGVGSIWSGNIYTNGDPVPSDGW